MISLAMVWLGVDLVTFLGFGVLGRQRGGSLDLRVIIDSHYRGVCKYVINYLFAALDSVLEIQLN